MPLQCTFAVPLFDHGRVGVFGNPQQPVVIFSIGFLDGQLSTFNFFRNVSVRRGIFRQKPVRFLKIFDADFKIVHAPHCHVRVPSSNVRLGVGRIRVDRGVAILHHSLVVPLVHVGRRSVAQQFRVELGIGGVDLQTFRVRVDRLLPLPAFEGGVAFQFCLFQFPHLFDQRLALLVVGVSQQHCFHVFDCFRKITLVVQRLGPPVHGVGVVRVPSQHVRRQGVGLRERPGPHQRFATQHQQTGPSGHVFLALKNCAHGLGIFFVGNQGFGFLQHGGHFVHQRAHCLNLLLLLRVAQIGLGERCSATFQIPHF